MIKILGWLALCLILTLPLAAQAENEQVPTEREIMQAENMPPLMPHAMPKAVGGSEEAACLSCHEKGLKGALQTSHPERKACTQCHIQGEIKAKKGGRKK